MSHSPHNRPGGWPLFLQSFIQRQRLQNKMWLETRPPLRPEDSRNILECSVLAMRPLCGRQACLTLPCQLELLALKAASNDRSCIAAVSCSDGRHSGFPKSASRLPFSPSCHAHPWHQQSLLLTEETVYIQCSGRTVGLKSGRVKGTKSAVPP